MNSNAVSAGEGASKPQANINKASSQARRANDPPRSQACHACHTSHVRCDISERDPCSRCESRNLDCVPYQSTNPAHPGRYVNRPSSGPNRGTFTLPNPRPAASQQSAPLKPCNHPNMSGHLGRTPDEQAAFESRNRFDNSDSESDHYRPAQTDGDIQVSLRGTWAVENTNRAAQLKVDPAPVALPKSTGGPDALPLLPSTGTLLTPVQLAAQVDGGSKKKRRRPKKKTKVTAITESGASTPSTSGPSIAATSFQTTTVEDEAEDPELDIEKHYQDQPFLLCCPSITVTSPISEDTHGDLMELAQRMAGMIPAELVIGPKVTYGVVWCDFPVTFGLAYHHKPSNERCINWYGTTSFQSGNITEIIVQAPEVVTWIEAPAVEKECLIRQPHCVDFACSRHLDHTFTFIEVKWQAQGEGRRREAIRKLCKTTGEDFTTFLRADRVEKQHIHL